MKWLITALCVCFRRIKVSVCGVESGSYFHFSGFEQNNPCNFFNRSCVVLLWGRPIYLVQSESDLLILSYGCHVWVFHMMQPSPAGITKKWHVPPKLNYNNYCHNKHQKSCPPFVLKCSVWHTNQKCCLHKYLPLSELLPWNMLENLSQAFSLKSRQHELLLRDETQRSTSWAIFPSYFSYHGSDPYEPQLDAPSSKSRSLNSCWCGSVVLFSQKQTSHHLWTTPFKSPMPLVQYFCFN